MHNGKFAMICKFKYAEICTKYATICSTKFARNMCKYANKKYAIHVHNKPKYAQMCKTKICSLSAHICKHTICINMQKMHKICNTKYAQTFSKYAKYALYSKYMHDMFGYASIYMFNSSSRAKNQCHTQTFATIKLLDLRVAAQGECPLVTAARPAEAVTAVTALPKI